MVADGGVEDAGVAGVDFLLRRRVEAAGNRALGRLGGEGLEALGLIELARTVLHGPQHQLGQTGPELCWSVWHHPQ